MRLEEINDADGERVGKMPSEEHLVRHVLFQSVRKLPIGGQSFYVKKIAPRDKRTSEQRAQLIGNTTLEVGRCFNFRSENSHTCSSPIQSLRIDLGRGKSVIVTTENGGVYQLELLNDTPP